MGRRESEASMPIGGDCRNFTARGCASLAMSASTGSE